MQKIAANKVLISKNKVLTNGVVARNEQKIVEAIFSLDECSVETCNTLFYNGLLTSFAEIKTIESGTKIGELVQNSLKIGQKGRLLLWKNVDLQNLTTTNATEVAEM